MAIDLKKSVSDFNDWLKTGTGDAAKWQREREERLAWYKKHIVEDRVLTITREEFAALVKGLWAVNIWRNKDYKVEKRLTDNGLDELREAERAKPRSKGSFAPRRRSVAKRGKRQRSTNP